MKRFLVACLLILVCVGAAPAFADDAPAVTVPSGDVPHRFPSLERKGLMLGLAAGGAMENVYTQSQNRSFGAFMGDLKLGYGINQRVQVLVNPSLMYAKVDSLTMYTYVIPVACQVFLYDNFFIRPGVGMTYSSRSFDSFNQAILTAGKVSYAFDIALGYEFRLSKYLGISPEFVYHYVRIPTAYYTTQDNIIGLQASLVSYIKLK